MVKKLNINAIRIDGGTQPRERIDMAVVGDYAEAVKVGIEFPPVVVFHDGAENWLADGFHRYHAHKQAGKASIVADVRSGTLLDAKLLAVGANGAHGLRRTNDDKRRAVQMVLDEPAWKAWSDRDVAEACGVSVPFVSAIRRPDVAAKQKENRAKAAEQPVDNRNPITAAPAPAAAVSDAPRTTPAPAPTVAPEDDGAPDEAEIAAAEREQQEELDALRKIAMADDKLAAALNEAKQLRALNRVLTERNNGLMNEKAELVRRIKSMQRKLDKQEQPA